MISRKEQFWTAVALAICVCWVIVLGLVVFSFVQLSRQGPPAHQHERNH